MNESWRDCAYHLFEARLVDRHLPGPQPFDALRQDIANDDLVAEVGEARTGDEADVAGSEDSLSAPWAYGNWTLNGAC